MKTVWRRQKSGLEFRPVRDPPRANCPVPNFGKADYSLHIAGTTFEDGGKYVCEVEGRTRMAKIITLRVIRGNRPTQPRICQFFFDKPLEIVLSVRCSLSSQHHFLQPLWLRAQEQRQCVMLVLGQNL